MALVEGLDQLSRLGVGKFRCGAVLLFAPAMPQPKHQNAARHRSAHLLLPRHSRSKPSGESQRRILIERPVIAVGVDDRLRAVVTFEKFADSDFGLGFHHSPCARLLVEWNIWKLIFHEPLCVVLQVISRSTFLALRTRRCGKPTWVFRTLYLVNSSSHLRKLQTKAPTVDAQSHVRQQVL